MSVVIIGGGGGVRSAVTALENASLTQTPAQRAESEKVMKHAKDLLDAQTNNPQPA